MNIYHNLKIFIIENASSTIAFEIFYTNFNCKCASVFSAERIQPSIPEKVNPSPAASIIGELEISMKPGEFKYPLSTYNKIIHYMCITRERMFKILPI
jgi:hypothetical protein